MSKDVVNDAAKALANLFKPLYFRLNQIENKINFLKKMYSKKLIVDEVPLICEFVVQEDTNTVIINTDMNGNEFSLKEFEIEYISDQLETENYVKFIPNKGFITFNDIDAEGHFLVNYTIRSKEPAPIEFFTNTCGEAKSYYHYRYKCEIDEWGFMYIEAYCEMGLYDENNTYIFPDQEIQFTPNYRYNEIVSTGPYFTDKISSISFNASNNTLIAGTKIIIRGK